MASRARPSDLQTRVPGAGAPTPQEWGLGGGVRIGWEGDFLLLGGNWDPTKVGTWQNSQTGREDLRICAVQILPPFFALEVRIPS